MSDYRYEIEKLRTRAALWAARRIPRRIVYWSLMNAGLKYIERDEIVPEVPLLTILSRVGDTLRAKR